MTRFVIPLIFIFLAPTTYAQTTTNADSGKQRKESNQIGVYELYPTKNYWTFIKLDTRNGKMWQVQFSIEDNKKSGELIINDTPLVSEEEQSTGRFTIYMSENMYSFLLLDRVNGNVVHAQWSFESKNRGLISLIKTF